MPLGLISWRDVATAVGVLHC